jgi:hypothetical protein
VKALAEAALALVHFSGRGGDLPDQVTSDSAGDYDRTGNSVPLTNGDLVIDCQRILGARVRPVSGVAGDLV